MRIDWWTLGLQAANVLILVWILGRFLFRPVAAMMEERRVAAAKLLDEALADRAAAHAERGTADAALADLAAQRAQALKVAAEEAEAEKQGILAGARAEADRLRAGAMADIARAHADAAGAQAEGARRLALDIAGRLFDRLPDAARVNGFIDGLAESVAGLPEAIRAGLAADASIRLTAPRALTEAERQACREALGKALGRAVTLEVSVDPGLIAGLEIDMPHAAVRNSFRADLARIGAALSVHGQGA